MEAILSLLHPRLRRLSGAHRGDAAGALWPGGDRKSLKAFRGYFRGAGLCDCCRHHAARCDFPAGPGLCPCALLYEIGAFWAPAGSARVSRAPDAEEGAGTEVEKSTDGH